MKVTNVEKKEKSIVALTVQVDAEAFEAAVQAAYLKNRGKLSVPGFRRGKAPRKILEGMYGTGVFYDDAINALYPDAYDAAVKEQGLDDVGYPQVEVLEASKENGFTFQALVSVRPEATVSQYKELMAPKAEVTVTDEDIEGELKPFIDRATRLVSVDRPLANGDTAVIDFEGFDNGTPFEGGKGQDYSLELGSGSFVPGFEEQLVGLKTGDEKDLDITFPEDYVPELAGKPVVFKVKVKEVEESQVPEVDDEFAKDVSEFETLAEFKADLGEKLKKRRELQAEQDFQNGVMEQLVAHMECEIPDAMVRVQTDRLMEDYAMRMRSQGLSMEDYMQVMGMNEQVMRASVQPSALKQVQAELALEAVAKMENIEVSQEELDAEVQRLAEAYHIEVDQVKAAVAEADLIRDLRLKKANEIVMSSAKVGEPPATEEAEKAEPEKEEKKPVRKRTTRKKKTEESVAEETKTEE